MIMRVKKQSISIVIPAFNEEENISWVVRDTLKNLPKYFKDFEVIVVDDGSSDKTGQLINKMARGNKSIRVIHQENGGYSKAMLAGIKAANKDYVAYLPADGQFLIHDMRHSFEQIGKADLILGYRGGRPDYTLKRMFMSYCYLMLLVILFDIKYMDVGWVNIWDTKKVQSLKLSGTGGIFILTEIVVKFMRNGYKIAEAPSYYHVRKAGEVKNAKFKVIKATFLNALKLKIEIIIKKI